LDFVSFTTAQPTAGTCTDTFQVSGATTVAPTICGNNDGQHSQKNQICIPSKPININELVFMCLKQILVYLDVPSSASTPTDVQLNFNFAAGTATRSWKIKMALLPCGATYLGKNKIQDILLKIDSQITSTISYLMHHSSDRLSPIFHHCFREGQVVQLAGRRRNGNSSTEQSRLQHLFQD
jgi:hypothetical protein